MLTGANWRLARVHFPSILPSSYYVISVCGIVGFTHEDRFVHPGLIRGATSCLIHRGPDQQDVYESKDVSLGAVRLTIIDLVSGEQPMRSEDDDTILAFNGEIYNHCELRAELQSLGHRFRTTSDTEVVLHAFLQWDTDCFRRLRGMFGLALWSQSRKRLVLARDRVGIKPVYFCRKGRDVYFSSELKGILHHPDIDRVLNLDGLNCYLRVNYVPAPYTLVQGIEKLPPGHILTWEKGATKVESYWRCPMPAETNRKWTVESAKEELDTLLRQSIKEHLVADVPVGLWASGGLDSSTILHYAAEASAKPLKTFSITFKGRSFDEGAYIQEVAKHYGTDHSEIDLSTDMDLETAIQEFAYFSDEPSADAGCLPVWYLAKMSSEQVTVALSGEGADELFGGYLTYLASRYASMARLVPAGLRKLAIAGLNYWPVSDEKISFEYKLKRFLRGSLLPADEAHIFWNGTFSEEEKAEFLLRADAAPMRNILRNMPPVPGINRYMLFDQQYYLPDDILYKADRMSMAHSLEVRPPFLDHRIVEFAASLPENYKLRGSRLKFLLKELMKGKLPDAILQRKKVGFDIPAHDWFRSVLKPLLLDTLTEKAVKESQIFRWEGIQSVIKRHMDRRESLGYHLWGLLILFLWIKRWNIQTLREPEPADKRVVSLSAIA
jgi:asparagine synthase (glutamine-hydrolysing)